MNIIASKRANLLSKYVSRKYKTYVVAGYPRATGAITSTKRYSFDNYTLIEIPTLFPKLVRSRATTQDRISKLSLLSRHCKIELLPVLELLFPISPGGMLFHNKSRFIREIDKIVVANKNKKIIAFASYGPLFVLRIGSYLKKKYSNVQFMIDFRDWGYNYYEGLLYRSIVFRNIMGRLTRNADLVSAVSSILLRKYTKYFSLDASKTIYLPNGYDNSETSIVSPIHKDSSCNSFVIAYTGSIHIKSINPEKFVMALRRVDVAAQSCEVDVCLKFIYAGKDSELIRYYFRKHHLLHILEDRKFVSREESLKIQGEADLLLLLTYTGVYKESFGSIITGKIYEYLLSPAPILVIGQDNWELGALISTKDGSGLINNNEESIYNFLLQTIRSKGRQREENDEFRDAIKMYSYENISNRLVDFIGSSKERS